MLFNLSLKMDHLKLTPDKLSIEEITDLVTDSSCGAASLFVGTTRDSFEGKKVLRLEYEAYEPMAIKAMKVICDDLRRQWPALHGIAIYHRLGIVPVREASVVLAVSSPHRADSLAAVAAGIDALKASVPVWKKEVYENGEMWKENAECVRSRSPSPPAVDDRDLVQINVSNEELQRRIQNYIDRKREQVNINNIHDFIPSHGAGDDDDSCARVRATLVKRHDSKGHLKIHKVHNEWGPQTAIKQMQMPIKPDPDADLPSGIAERMRNVEKYLGINGPLPKDIYERLRALEDRLAELQAVSPEYAQFWQKMSSPVEERRGKQECLFTANDIARKIEQLQKMG